MSSHIFKVIYPEEEFKKWLAVFLTSVALCNELRNWNPIQNPLRWPLPGDLLVHIASQDCPSGREAPLLLLVDGLCLRSLSWLVSVGFLLFCGVALSLWWCQPPWGEKDPQTAVAGLQRSGTALCLRCPEELMSQVASQRGLCWGTVVAGMVASRMAVLPPVSGSGLPLPFLSSRPAVPSSPSCGQGPWLVYKPQWPPWSWGPVSVAVAVTPGFSSCSGQRRLVPSRGVRGRPWP